MCKFALKPAMFALPAGPLHVLGAASRCLEVHIGENQFPRPVLVDRLRVAPAVRLRRGSRQDFISCRFGRARLPGGLDIRPRRQGVRRLRVRRQRVPGPRLVSRRHWTRRLFDLFGLDRGRHRRWRVRSAARSFRISGARRGGRGVFGTALSARRSPRPSTSSSVCSRARKKPWIRRPSFNETPETSASSSAVASRTLRSEPSSPKQRAPLPRTDARNFFQNRGHPDLAA